VRIEPAPRIVVAAGVIERDGAYLLTRRLDGTHLAGFWEFPGGKCEQGETLPGCLERELLEELGCRTLVGGELLSVVHTYPERVVELHFFRCVLLDEPRPLLGQEVRWASPHELSTLELPPADADLITLLLTG
jgi:8-oxo-dGTP diphosphatase